MTAYSNTRRVINFSSQEPQNHYDLWLKKIGCGDNSRYELQIYDCDRWHTILGGEGSGSSGEYELSVIQSWMQGSGADKYVLGHKMSIEDGDEKNVYLPFKWDSENNTLYFIDENGDPHEIGGGSGGGSDPTNAKVSVKYAVDNQESLGKIQYMWTYNGTSSGWNTLTTNGVSIPLGADVQIKVTPNSGYNPVYLIGLVDKNGNHITGINDRTWSDITSPTSTPRSFAFTMQQQCQVVVQYYNYISIVYEEDHANVTVQEDTPKATSIY